MQTVSVARETEQVLNGLSGEQASVGTLVDVAAAWNALSVARMRADHLNEQRIIAFDGSDPDARVFDMLRTHAYRRLQQNQWTSLAVTAPSAGCGSSVVATNLAFSLARQEGCRVLLVDLNLRRPQLASLLGIDHPPSIEVALRSNALVQHAVLRCSENLAVLTNNRAVPRPAELLQSTRIVQAIETLRMLLMPQVVIFDLPPLRPHDDTLAFLPKVDCAMLVLEAEETTAEQADLAEFEIRESTAMLGVVLNKCQYAADPLLAGASATRRDQS